MKKKELYEIGLDLALKYIEKLEGDRPGELVSEEVTSACQKRLDYADLSEQIRSYIEKNNVLMGFSKAEELLEKIEKKYIKKFNEENIEPSPPAHYSSSDEYRKWIEWNFKEGKSLKWFEDELRRQDGVMKSCEKNHEEKLSLLTGGRINIVSEYLKKVFDRLPSDPDAFASRTLTPEDPEWNKILTDD